MLPHILSLVIYLFLLPSLGQARVSDVFNIQPDQCVTCLTPVYNGCEAAEGPYGTDPAAFAGCICASSAISRVAICTHDGGGCASTGAAVGQAAQTWCFLNDAAYKATVCGSKDGGVGYKYIPHAILRQVCDPKDPAVSVAGPSSAATATSVLRPEVKPSGAPAAEQSPTGGQAGKKTQNAATKAEGSETKVTKAAAAVATDQKKSATEIDPTSLATDTDSTAMALVTASPSAVNMTSSLPSVSSSRSSGGSATTDINPSSSSTGSSSGSSSSSSDGDNGNGKKDTGSGATRDLRPGAGFAGAIIALVVPALMARVH